MNQIQSLIAKHVQGDVRKREELIQHLKLEGIEEPKRLMELLEATGEVRSKFMRMKLHKVLGIDQYIVRTALLCDKDTRAEEREIAEVRARHGQWKDFKPTIFVRTEREVPHPIFIAVMSGSHRRKTIQVDESILNLPEIDQFASISEIIKDHYAKCHTKHYVFGWILGFGRIIQYDFQQTYYRTVGFDPEGQVLGTRWVKHPPVTPKAQLFVGKTEVSAKMETLMFPKPDTPHANE